MTRLHDAVVTLHDLIAAGGFVVAILLAMSILSGAVVLGKVWQFRAMAVGRHGPLREALRLWEAAEPARAMARLRGEGGFAPIALQAMLLPEAARRAARDRLYNEAERRMARLESGFRLLDSVAQLAPLLGLFGTVLGMIDAFRAMQAAGAQVDPPVLAGGIWTALLTTAAGLAVAMMVTAVLTWLEGRAAAERQMAEDLVETLCGPALAHLTEGPEAVVAGAPAHA